MFYYSYADDDFDMMPSFGNRVRPVATSLFGFQEPEYFISVPKHQRRQSARQMPLDWALPGYFSSENDEYEEFEKRARNKRRNQKRKERRQKAQEEENLKKEVAQMLEKIDQKRAASETNHIRVEPTVSDSKQQREVETLAELEAESQTESEITSQEEEEAINERSEELQDQAFYGTAAPNNGIELEMDSVYIAPWSPPTSSISSVADDSSVSVEDVEEDDEDFEFVENASHGSMDMECLIVPVPLEERWAKELEILKKLGFENISQNIKLLETKIVNPGESIEESRGIVKKVLPDLL